MKALVIGYSRIAAKRVLPALARLPEVSAVAVATRRGRPPEADLEVFDDYEKAISASGAGLAYVSLENANHAAWVERALRQGMHVVVDKPAFLSAADARRLAALAQAQRRCLAEATVFAFHPQIAALLDVFAQAGARPARAFAAFSFPPLDPGDFRYRREQGGGALYDLGPYAAATSRLLFGEAPRSVACEVLARRPDGLDTAFSALFTYAGGRALAGHFGFDTEYQNRLLAFGPGVAAELQRAFTLPPEASNRIAVRRANAEAEVAVAPGDAFELYLRALAGAIARGDWESFTQALLQDAELLGKMRQATGEPA